MSIILGCEFLMNHGYVLDFEWCTFHRAQIPEEVLQLLPTKTTPQPLHTITMDDEGRFPIAVLSRKAPAAERLWITMVQNSSTPCNIRYAYRHTPCSQISATWIQITVFTRTRLHKHHTTHHRCRQCTTYQSPTPFHYAEWVHQLLQEMIKKVSSNPAKILGALLQLLSLSPQAKSGYVLTMYS